MKIKLCTFSFVPAWIINIVWQCHRRVKKFKLLSAHWNTNSELADLGSEWSLAFLKGFWRAAVFSAPIFGLGMQNPSRVAYEAERRALFSFLSSPLTIETCDFLRCPMLEESSLSSETQWIREMCRIGGGVLFLLKYHHSPSPGLLRISRGL